MLIEIMGASDVLEPVYTQIKLVCEKKGLKMTCILSLAFIDY
jgi:enamine deaminase RidA (YjgF/YER057c/UK114 family)